VVFLSASSPHLGPLRVSGFVLANHDLEEVSGLVLANHDLEEVSGFALADPDLKEVSGLVSQALS
jgi:hypothetical protein